ncbi:MAG: 2-keto-4-pentenoate hydratase [Silanimonas sp.]
MNGLEGIESAEASAAVAARFVEARRAARALPQYPGALPRSLDEAYARQDAAIGLWGEPVLGWKVGRIPEAWVESLGEDRLMGPVFASRLQWLETGDELTFPVIRGGFAAIEAEYIVVLGNDADPSRTDYTPLDAASLVRGLHIGVELAGSPLPTINELGPPVVVSDFGNNAGVYVGRAIEDWRQRAWARLVCATWIDGRVAGRGGALSLPGGPLAALAFALNRGARRGWPLKAGMIVSTGAATGIHDILPGQRALIGFEGLGDLTGRAFAAQPMEGVP